MIKLLVIFYFTLILVFFGLTNPNENSLKERFSPPPGFERSTAPAHTFEAFLQSLPLKEHGSLVRFHDGRLKDKPNVYCAVVDYSLGSRDLQQCADAVMRLRAEYFYAQKQYGKIKFNFLHDGKPRFFVNYAKGRTDRKTFDNYLDYVFSSANTASLRKEMQPVSSNLNMQIGDLFIVQGVPFGHAIIVVDMAVNKETGKKLFMLAQSYMPAQDIQILINPNDPNLSPWYTLKNETLVTPEWTFPVGNLRRFKP